MNRDRSNSITSLQHLLVPCVTTVLAASAGAQPIASDGFAYSPAGNALNSYAPGGSGWLGGWDGESGAWTVQAGSLGYSAGGKTLLTSGNKIHGSSAVSKRNLNLGADLGAPGTTLWVSFLARQTGGGPNQSFAGLRLPTGPSTFLFLGKPYNDARWGIDGGPGTTHRLSNTPTTMPVFLLAKIDFKEGADDVYLWVNPPTIATEPATGSAQVQAIGYNNFQNIQKAVLEMGSLGAPIQADLDEIRLGRSFSDVAPADQPAYAQEMEVLMEAQGHLASQLARLYHVQSEQTLSLSSHIDLASRQMSITIAPGQQYNGHPISGQLIFTPVAGGWTSQFIGIYQEDQINAWGDASIQRNGNGGGEGEFTVNSFVNIGPIGGPSGPPDPGNPPNWADNHTRTFTYWDGLVEHSVTLGSYTVNNTVVGVYSDVMDAIAINTGDWNWNGRWATLDATKWTTAAEGHVDAAGNVVNGDFQIHFTPGCLADFNNDLFLDFFDIDEYVNAFESNGDGADFNADGFVDFFDLDSYLAAFEIGC